MHITRKLLFIILLAILPFPGISRQEGNTLRGTFSLNRLDYNVGEGVSTFLVSNPVEVTIRSVLVP